MDLTLNRIVDRFPLEVLSGAGRLDRSVRGGYASDLLSCVMAGAKEGNIWVTLQAHPNVIAVADLRELACVIITEGMRPDDETVARANDKGIPLLLSEENTFQVVGRLIGLGVR